MCLCSNEGRLKALFDRKTLPGKTSYLTNEQQAELKRLILNSTPAEQGMGMYASWDIRVVRTSSKEKCGISVPQVGILKMLVNWGCGIPAVSPKHSVKEMRRNNKPF